MHPNQEILKVIMKISKKYFWLLFPSQQSFLFVFILHLPYVFIQTFKNSWSKRNMVGSSTQIVIFSNSYNDVQNYQIQIDFPQ